MSNAASVIVVTGGNRGIGFEICRQLAGRGAQVVLTARKPVRLERAVTLLIWAISPARGAWKCGCRSGCGSTEKSAIPISTCV